MLASKAQPHSKMQNSFFFLTMKSSLLAVMKQVIDKPRETGRNNSITPNNSPLP
jgi:CRISPR/Cas system-associated endoribonuclease Cas2